MLETQTVLEVCVLLFDFASRIRFLFLNRKLPFQVVIIVGTDSVYE